MLANIQYAIYLSIIHFIKNMSYGVYAGIYSAVIYWVVALIADRYELAESKIVYRAASIVATHRDRPLCRYFWYTLGTRKSGERILWLARTPHRRSSLCSYTRNSCG